ncbi:hypothetical protein J6590_016652 [Homalodisca vitripennis]|nr:hypothetical protein J6590_016652 [Homalodisca vitripennis]
MPELKWNVDSVIKFLNIFKTYSCLWDPSDENYNKRDARDVALKKLGSHLESEGFGHINKDQLKIKIKSLKDSYRVELNQVKTSLKSGAGAEDIYKPKLGWFSVADSFWRTVMMGRDSSSNLEPGINSPMLQSSTSTADGGKYVLPAVLLSQLCRAHAAFTKMSVCVTDIPIDVVRTLNLGANIPKAFSETLLALDSL